MKKKKKTETHSDIHICTYTHRKLSLGIFFNEIQRKWISLVEELDSGSGTGAASPTLWAFWWWWGWGIHPTLSTRSFRHLSRWQDGAVWWGRWTGDVNCFPVSSFVYWFVLLLTCSGCFSEYALLLCGTFSESRNSLSWRYIFQKSKWQCKSSLVRALSMKAIGRFI